MSSSDRNLLFGILALQMDFITRDALIAAIHAWVLDKAKPLGQILVEQGHLNPQHLALLEPLVQAHIEAHNNDPQQSLASLSSVSSVRDELESLLAVGPTQQARIDAICDRFEAAWRAAASSGERPRIEDYVGDPAASEYAILLCELAALDIAYRRLAGENPSVDEYAARFPDLDATRLARMLARQEPATIDQPTSCNGSGLRYRILRPHARGGLGEIFVALDQELHREVALKEIKEERAHDSVSRGRFLLEAEITGGLEHPGIVPVYGLGQYSDGRPFYAMRFIKGDNLKEAIRRFHEAEKPGRDPGERSLALRDLLRRFVDVCNAVAYAHSRGVLHRDLKPGNIMLGKYGETLIVDWGLAKSVGRSDQTRTTEESTWQPSSGSDWAATVMGTVIGTPAYMSPEQAAGRLDLLGPASDIYSLGAMLYALLTGTPPFDESDRAELLQQVQRGAWRPPRQVKPNTPAALDAICRKAMALRPEDRYATALALAADVEHWLADEPVTAYREPWSVRTRRWMRRHRPWVAGSSALLMATVPLSLVIAIQAERDKQEITKQKDVALANEKETRAVLDFVEHRIFAAARPEEARRRGTFTFEQAIKAALPFADKSLTDQPLIEARLRVMLGTTLLSSLRFSGDNAKIAVAQFEAARTLYAQHRGPDHPDTLSSMSNLANSYAVLGRHADAVKLHEETLAVRKAKLGPDHPDTLSSMSNLANSYDALGRHADALKLREDALPVMRAKLGPDHSDTLTTCMNNLAHSYGRVRRHADAARLFEEELALQKSILGPDDWRTLLTMSSLANSYFVLGRHADTARLYEEELALQKSTLGPDNWFTLSTMRLLALSYVVLGRHAEALKLREETLVLQKAKLGPDHPDTLQSMNKLAQSYAAVGRHAEALKLCRETAALWEKLNRTDASSLYNAACWRAVTAAVLRANDPSPTGTKQAVAEADKAMSWLKKAVAAGYKDAAHMQKDKDLDALRDREDFKKLMAELAAGRAKEIVGPIPMP
jgi:serine/threonine protein kinase